MKRIRFLLFIVLAGINIFFASWSVLHNDVFFTSDIARDMYLLQEIAQKKVVLIGPRSSVGGLFHGPLWSYVTFPGYLLGNGNPVAVGWYWILLIVLFLISSYFIAKKLFNQNTAILFILMMSLYFAFHANALFNPHGALFVLPACLFFYVRYIKTTKVTFLLYHLFTVACMIQFQMAIGLPFLILSAIFTFAFALKHHTYGHLAAFLLIPLLLINFIVFNFRHALILSHNALRHLGTTAPGLHFSDLLYNRVDYIFNRLEFLRFGPPHGQLLSVTVFFIFLFLQIQQNIHRTIYLIFLYFFFGFFTLSLVNRYFLIDFYVFPLLSLVFLMFSSFITGKQNRVFVIVFFVMYGLNLVGLSNYIQGLNQFIGNDQYSWKALFTAAKSAYQGPEKEFGYFVYSPGIVGYGPRYAMEYARTIYHKNGYAFQKKPITYLLIEPPPTVPNRFISEEIWKINKVHIYSIPVMVKTFSDGYKMEKHVLVSSDYLPFDPGINPGLQYR